MISRTGDATWPPLLPRTGTSRPAPGVDTAVLISTATPILRAWRERLPDQGITHVHDCPSIPAARTVIDGLGPARILVLLDATLPGTASDLGTGRDDHLVVIGVPEPATAHASLATGSRAYLLPPAVPAPRREPDPVDDGAGRGTGEAGGYRVEGADGTRTWLTWREVQILRRVADGLGNQEIADLLGLSMLTVKSHLARASHRLGARDRAHLVLLGLRSAVIT